MSKLSIFGAVTVTAIGSALAALNFGPSPSTDQVIVGLQAERNGGVAGAGAAELGTSGSATTGRQVDGDATGKIAVAGKNDDKNDDKDTVVWSYDHKASGTSDTDTTSETDSGSSESKSGSGTRDGGTKDSATWSYDYTYEHDSTSGTSSGSGNATVEKPTEDKPSEDKPSDGHEHQGEGNVTWDHDSDGGSVTWEWGDKSGTVAWDTGGWDTSGWDGKDWDK